MAAGTADTDAANIAQLKAVSSEVGTLSDRAVTYDGAIGDPKDTITLAGTNGTVLTNVKAGTLSDTSTDAVNGSQLHTTNESLAALASDALTWNSTFGAYDASHGTGSPQKIMNVADGTAANDAVNKGQLDEVSSEVGALSDRAVTYDGTIGDPKDTITLAGTNGTVLTNVKAGTLSDTSTDAVNGSQLHTTNESLAALASDALTWNSTFGAYDASHGTQQGHVRKRMPCRLQLLEQCEDLGGRHGSGLLFI